MILQHAGILIPVSLLLGAMISAAISVWKQNLAYPIAQLTSTVALLFSIAAMIQVLTHGTIHYHLGSWPPPLGIEYVIDPLSALVALIVTGIGFFVITYSHRSIEKELSRQSVPFYIIALLFLGGLCGMAVTGDLFNLYVFLEIASLTAYALTSVGDKRAPVAAFRYLLLGTIGASFYLLGLAYIYFVTGSLNMQDVAQIIPMVEQKELLYISLSLMVTGISLKLALFPLHLWLPDAYTYASSVGSALLAPIGTKVSAYVLIRLLYTVFKPEFIRSDVPILTILTWMAITAVVAGSIMAIAQNDLKRMLAYSSVAQIGYITLGIGLANPLGFIGAVLHILNHAVMKATLFLVSGSLFYKIGSTSINHFDNKLQQIMPYTASAFTISALSMIGIPPTAGFFSKWYLVLASIDSGNWLVIVAIGLSTLLNAVYFFRILERMYLRRKNNFEQGDTDKNALIQRRDEVPLSMLVPTVTLGILVIVLGIFNGLIVDYVIKIALPPGL